VKGKNQEKSVLNFICEAGLLKRTKRSGWSVLGIEPCESVAEHSFRCAVIGYCLAKMEGADPYEVLLMTLFGDIHEARIGDFHKMTQRYLEAPVIEDRAYGEQVEYLPAGLRKELLKARAGYRGQKNRESVIARDADILECLLQAKEYYEHGYLEAMKFTKKAPLFLKTAGARSLWKKAKTSKLNDWWESLSDFKR
jgi:putative hydrolases of HD superfamily